MTTTKNKATLAATKRALHAMMKQDGLLFPETPEDVDRMEATATATVRARDAANAALAAHARAADAAEEAARPAN